MMFFVACAASAVTLTSRQRSLPGGHSLSAVLSLGGEASEVRRLRGGEFAASEVRGLALSQLQRHAKKTLGIPDDRIDAALDSAKPREALLTLIEQRCKQELHLVTFATHEQGLLQRLAHNEFGCEVAILGMGSKWKGYMDSKMRAVLDYVKALPPERVVVYLDAFDTLMLKDPSRTLVRAFEATRCDVLVSEDPYIMSPALTKLRFGAGNVLERAGGDRAVANAGMFMGYAGALVALIESLFEMGYKDDQIALNKAVQANGQIKVDLDHEIFHNANQTRDKDILPQDLQKRKLAAALDAAKAALAQARASGADAVGLAEAELELAQQTLKLAQAKQVRERLASTIGAEQPQGNAPPDDVPQLASYFISFPFGVAENWDGWAKRVQRDALFHVLGLFTGDK